MCIIFFVFLTNMILPVNSVHKFFLAHKNDLRINSSLSHPTSLALSISSAAASAWNLKFYIEPNSREFPQ